MAKVTPLSGFPEWLPEQQLVQNRFIATIREHFERYGFAPIETRSVEPLDVLLKKGETDKEIYVLRRLQADDKSKDKGVGLHFDLTVPFARYVAEHQHALIFPVKRYQIQKAWRGERPQEGRYREFLQADIDVVAREKLPLHFDIEMPGLLAEVLGSLPIPPVTIEVNNRKLIEGFYRGLDISDVPGVMRTVDKLDKVGSEGVATMLSNLGLSSHQVDKVMGLCEIASGDLGFVDEARALDVTHPLFEEGLGELTAVIEGNQHHGGKVAAALRIARGLDYYTGTVYEGTMSGFERIGAVCSGGRYDNLVGDAKQKMPGVGVSIGVTRILGVLFGNDRLAGSRQTPTCVLVALNNQEHRPEAVATARRLRDRGINTEVYHLPQKFGKQIQYASRKGIPYVLFRDLEGGGHQLRDLETGEQAKVDLDTWEPPERLRSPQVTTPGNPGPLDPQ